MPKQTVLIIAGGTGGHIVPGLGLALEFAQSTQPAYDVLFLSLEKNRTYADFADVPFPVHFYAAPPITKQPLALLEFPLRFARALWQAWRLLRAHDVSFVIGMGGYSIFPGIVAARLTGVPYYLCEQNAVPGRATRLFAGGARRIFLNFPVAAKHQTADFTEGRVVLAGNPLRPKLRLSAGTQPGASGRSKKAAVGNTKKTKQIVRKQKNGQKIKSKLKINRRGAAEDLTVLVLGGSQGAAQINAMVAAAISELSPRPVGRWIIQCGEKNLEQMRAQLPPKKYPNVTLLGYHPAIHEFYRTADLVICRAGAGVLSEALVIGLPMILIPYPYAADNHQLANAVYLSERGVAHCISQTGTEPAELIHVIREWSGSARAQIETRSQLAAALARPDAAAEILAEIQADAGAATTAS